jgi:Domain of unknown function (DUF397)
MDLSRISWRKASYSSGNGGDCVEVGIASRIVAVRDSKNPDGPKLAFTPGSWHRFIRRAKTATNGR